MHYKARNVVQTIAAIGCTIIFSSAFLLSAVGPVRAADVHHAIVSAQVQA